jgi:hypothetical protein
LEVSVVTTVSTLRQLALSLPDVTEQSHFGRPSFRRLGKILATVSGDGEHAVLKLTPGDQHMLVAVDPQTFSVVPRWGQFGWTDIVLAGVSRSRLSELVDRAYQQVAPKADAQSRSKKATAKRGPRSARKSIRRKERLHKDRSGTTVARRRG